MFHTVVFFFSIPKKESNICKNELKSELQLSKPRGKYELKLTLLLFYICMFLWKNCSNECCFSLVPRNQNQSWVLLQNRDFWSCLAFPRYSNNWEDIWLENSFTKTFVLTQHQQDITQTTQRSSLNYLSHVHIQKIMLMIQRKTATSCQRSCPTVHNTILA